MDQRIRPIRVLSLFDGMSCGQIALRELGIPVAAYYASEVDKFAIAQTQLNFPETIQLGDVRNIDVDKLCEDGEIDLLLAGFPCTNLSFAGKRAGLATKENIEILTLDQYLDLKDADFEFEGQSYLFWEFMRVLTALRRRNPNIIFLLENVEMGKKWERVLSEAVGIRGVHINSALVSAQNRKRIYWSNIRVRKEGLFGYRYTDIPQPTDRGILLRDILEKEVDEKYFLKDNIAANVIKRFEFNKAKGYGYGGRIHDENGKMCAVRLGGHGEYDLIQEQTSEYLRVPDANDHLQKNLTDVDSKANAFLATSHKGAWANGMSLVSSNFRIRRITPTECARLQTIPDWYIWNCSATQQYRLLGNGWTVEVIKHIFSFMRLEDTV